MKRTLLNDGWQFREKVNPFAEIGGPSAPYVDVNIPHDALISRERDPNGDAGAAYFPPGAYQYRRTFDAPSDLGDRRVVLEFEGVYRDAMVYINGALAGQRPYGYSVFRVDADQYLRPGEENLIEVEARNGQDARWYTGAGIYRDVWLLTARDVHVAPAGLRVTTHDSDGLGAVVEVSIDVRNTRNRPVTVDVDALVRSPDGAIVGEATAPVTVPAHGRSVSRQRLYVASPRRWSAETPELYSASVRVSADGEELDADETLFGIRQLQLDPVHGLRVNGATVKLRGACIHHDNGILGAATLAAAEERRIRLLKEAGFNAIRSSHNPLSRAALDACDRLGMYVMDETFDVWTSGKTAHDYALHFADWWERDVEALVEKDINHPSVIMYSIGNEIPETGSPEGGVIGRELAEQFRRLDPTRFVTNAVNGMLAVMDDIRRMAAERGAATDEGAGINTLMAGPGEFMNQIGSSPLVTERTAESFGLLDVAGMNYLDSRYVMDQELFPNRIIVGTETFPTNIDVNWGLVREHAHVIGDFTWTGFDYLGEVGIGRPNHLADGEQPSLSARHPWIAAWCGDLDIVGTRRPASFYREIVFGLRQEPYIAVVRPGNEDRTLYAGPWTWSDSVGSWSWAGQEGTRLAVEVYSDAERVELVLNGETIGMQDSGADHRFRARFEVPYVPGRLVAWAVRDGARAESYVLESRAEAIGIRLAGAFTDDGIAFAEIELCDTAGVVAVDHDVIVRVTLDGPAELIALGSGNPAPRGGYGSPQHSTFDGRALAVLRRTGEGEVVLRVDADDAAVDGTALVL
ncbi:glycoside hydrolase family 2 TIM barrel-domain containing protein [Microbacterium sp. NPDC055903]